GQSGDAQRGDLTSDGQKTRELSFNHANDPNIDYSKLSPDQVAAARLFYNYDLRSLARRSNSLNKELGLVAVKYFVEGDGNPRYALTGVAVGNSTTINIRDFNEVVSAFSSENGVLAFAVAYLHTHPVESGGWYQTTSGRFPSTTQGNTWGDVAFANRYGPLFVTRGGGYLERYGSDTGLTVVRRDSSPTGN
ncbi:hypothetical protein MLD52_22685, partial [Puniceicoccaceae bacterium K14]|nr:hypothetical protein [Puniceicoccaceae bacterium K14]